MIGLYIAYVIPVLLRRLNRDFEPGPWNLGRFSAVVGWVAVVWVVIICILFVLPPVSPVDVSTFNYAPVAVLVVLAFATISWFAGGRHTFMLASKDQATSPEAEKVLDAEP